MAKLGIDAVNLTGGGGLTHIVELLRHADPIQEGFQQVIIWGGESLSAVEDQPWLEKRIVITNTDSYWKRMTWASRHLESSFADANCDLLFCPAGTFSSKRIAYVSMVQNMLPYDDAERRRYPWGWNRLRYNLLRMAQKKSLRHAAGNIFVSQYALDQVTERFRFVSWKPRAVIYHGVNVRFLAGERPAQSKPGPLRLLYVSRVNYYKHQWNVIEAVNQLNQRGCDIQLRLVGETLPALEGRIAEALSGAAPGTVVMTGNIPYDQIEKEYWAADAFVFASTCESISNIVVEAMSAGLPIACSHYGPMPEILADSGIYFDPLSVESIVTALERLATDSTLRRDLSQRATARAKWFSWNKAARETFMFLRDCLRKYEDRHVQATPTIENQPSSVVNPPTACGID